VTRLPLRLGFRHSSSRGSDSEKSWSPRLLYDERLSLVSTVAIFGVARARARAGWGGGDTLCQALLATASARQLHTRVLRWEPGYGAEGDQPNCSGTGDGIGSPSTPRLGLLLTGAAAVTPSFRSVALGRRRKYDAERVRQAGSLNRSPRCERAGPADLPGVRRSAGDLAHFEARGITAFVCIKVL